MPANFTFGGSDIALGPTFAFHCEGCAAGSLLPAAFARYAALLAASHAGGHTDKLAADAAHADGPSLARLDVLVDSMEERKTLQLGMDESYSLTVPGGGTAGLATLHGA